MDEENFKVKMELDTDQFYKDLDKIENVTKNIDKNPHKISLFVDKKDFDKQTREAFDAFDKMALRNSKVNMARSLFGNKNEYYAYARIFNDIRANAMDALRDISNEGRKLQLKLETDNVDEAKSKLSELENQLQELQSKSDNYSWLDMNKDQMTDALNQAIKERKVLSGKRLTPIRLGENDIAQQYTKQINELTTRINQMRDKLSGGLGVSKTELDSYEKLKQEIAQVTQMIVQLKAQIGTGNVVSEDDNAKLQQLRQSYDEILEDLKKNPLYVQLTSQELSKQNKHNKEILSHYRGINKEARKMTMFSRITSSMFTRMRFQIVSLLNPFNRAKDIWQEFTSQNKIVSNTFSMIGKNFVRIITPLLMKLSQTLVNISGYADKFLMGMQKAFGVKEPISLFDVKGLTEAERKLKNMNSLTAGFDELHGQNDLTDLEKWGTITPTLAPEWENNFEKWGEKAGKIFGWAMEHPLLAALAAIFGTTLLKLLGKGLLKGLGWLGSKLFGGLFGGSAAKKAATAGGSLLGSLFGKTLYTGMNGKAVTVGKLLGGIALTAGGTALAISQAADAGKNWEDLSSSQKAVKIGLVGLGSAAAGVGAVLLGATGPVGALVALGVAGVSAVVGLSQAQNGIGSLKEETKEWEEAQQALNEALSNSKEKNTTYQDSLITLRQLEEQTGLSGEELAKAVDSGALSTDKMTSAQLQVYQAYLNTKDALGELTEARKVANSALETEAKEQTDVIFKNAQESKSYDELANHINDSWESGIMSTETARDEISRCMAEMSESARQELLEKLDPALRQGLDYEKYQSGWNEFGRFWENLWTNAVGVWDSSFANMKATEDDLKTSTDALTAAQNELKLANDNLSAAEQLAGMSAEELEQKINNGEIQVDELTEAQKRLREEYANYLNKSAEVDTALQKNGENVTGLAKQAYESSGDWKTFIDTLIQANAEGKISTEDMEREIGIALGEMDGTTEKVAESYLQSIGKMTNGVETACNEQKGFFESLFESIGTWVSETSSKLGNFFSGKGWKSNSEIAQEQMNSQINSILQDDSIPDDEKQRRIQALKVPSYDVGTPYVPNDQLAMVHQGEAIIPAKYNRVYGQTNSSTDNSLLYQTIDAMNTEIGELRSLIQQGIPVTGQFVQRGNDLYATVEKAKSRRGTQPLSNAAYAR